MRMMCGKTLRDGIPNGLLRDRTGVEDTENHLVETKLRWLGHLERIDETKKNLVKRVREERVLGHMKRGRSKISWNEVVKEDMKNRGLYINDAQARDKWIQAAEEWSISVKWEEDPAAIKAEQREDISPSIELIEHIMSLQFRYSFICQGTSTRRQRRDLFVHRVKLPPVTTSLTTQR